jgi:hypothetical protein
MPAERREALLDEFEKSGVSGAEFARLAGLKYSSFQNWVQTRRRRRAPAGEASLAQDRVAGVASLARPAVRFLEATLADEGGGAMRGGAVWLELPGGARLRLEAPAQVDLAAELLRALELKLRRSC